MPNDQEDQSAEDGNNDPWEQNPPLETIEKGN